MLSFRDGDGRGAEGIIAYERVPKATSFGEKAMTDTLKTSKGWRTRQNLNHNFVSHSPGRSAVFSPRCVELSKALPGSTWSTPHDLGFVSETHSKHFLLTFRDTLETKKVNKARSNPRSQQHIVPTFLWQRLSHSSDGSLKRGRQPAVDHRARRDHRS